MRAEGALWTTGEWGPAGRKGPDLEQEAAPAKAVGEELCRRGESEQETGEMRSERGRMGSCL